MAICITVMYFWYFMLLAAAAEGDYTLLLSTCGEPARHRSGTGVRKGPSRSPGIRGILTVKSAISTSGAPLTGETLPGDLNERYRAAATHVCADSLISLELRIDWLIHSILVRTGSLLWFEDSHPPPTHPPLSISLYLSISLFLFFFFLLFLFTPPCLCVEYKSQKE